MNKIALFFCCLSLKALAQPEYTASAIPAELKEQANVVIRRDEMTFTIRPNGDAELETVFIATILNASGKSAGFSVAIENRFSHVKTMKGRLFDAAGNPVRSTKEEDIQVYGSAVEYEFSDTKNKYLQLEHPQFPYTVEFRGKVELKGFLGIPSSNIQSLGVSVEHWKYNLVAPADYSFKWKLQNADIQPQVTSFGSNKMWTWEINHLPAIPEEPFHPFFKNVYSQILFAPETIRFDGHEGNFSNWNEAGRFFYALNNGREDLSSKTLSRVKEITRGKTAREKIADLYRLTQQECRYVSIQLGIGGWQTFPAEVVEKKKYGDCKALSNYTQALLRAAGIEAWEAAIYAGEEGAPECDAAFPDPYFNHVILYIPGEDMWLECTSNTHPAGYLGDFTANRCALLYTPEGGKLVRTPALGAADNLEDNHTAIQLAEDGAALIQHHARMNGERQDVCRRLALKGSREDLEKNILENTGITFNKLEKLDVKIETDRPEARLEYQASAQKFATLSGKRMFVALTKTAPFKHSLPANDKRRLDLQMKNAYALRDTFVLRFPPGFEAENVPTGKVLESEFGRYEIQIDQQSEYVAVIRRVEIRPLHVPAARYNEVRQFLLDVSKADAAQMVLIKK